METLQSCRHIWKCMHQNRMQSKHNCDENHYSAFQEHLVWYWTERLPELKGTWMVFLLNNNIDNVLHFHLGNISCIKGWPNKSGNSIWVILTVTIRGGFLTPFPQYSRFSPKIPCSWTKILLELESGILIDLEYKCYTQSNHTKAKPMILGEESGPQNKEMTLTCSVANVGFMCTSKADDEIIVGRSRGMRPASRSSWIFREFKNIHIHVL